MAVFRNCAGFSFAAALAICLWTKSLAQDAKDAKFACSAGWTLMGYHCYRLYTEEMEWADAQGVCHSSGANLVSVYGYGESKSVAELVKQKGESQFWIDKSAHHIYEDRDGFWAGGEPLDDVDYAYIQVDMPNEYYEHPWRKARGNEAKPFLCEIKACLEGFEMCRNGQCLRDSSALCDGIADCDDASDEMNCPNNCRNYYTGTSGTIKTDNPYKPNSDCHWTIESPVGTRAMLDFTTFRTESQRDKVEICIGGPTLTTCKVIATLSGDLDVTMLPRYHSNNNFLIVKFTSDSSVVEPGIAADWSTADVLPGDPETLFAEEDVIGQIKSPITDGQVVSALRKSWLIAGPLARRVLSLQVAYFDLADDQFVEVYDGTSLSSPLLARMSGKNRGGPQFVVSTSNVVTVYFNSGMEDYRGAGFQINYQIGCKGAIVADHGEVTSPGYMAALHYPGLQDCQFTVVPETSGSMSMIIDPEFELNGVLGDDSLKIYAGEDNQASILTSHVGGGPITPSQITSTSGKFFFEFHSTSINEGKGFKATFSKDCPNPNLPDDARVTPTLDPISGLSLGSEYTVSCPPGFTFLQEEHEKKTSVELVCEAGGWNVNRVPRCERKYCGQPPLVDNGYIEDTDEEPVFEATVTYKCYAGYSVVGAATISCDDHPANSEGRWTTPPTCSAARCSGLPSIPNGDVSTVEGTGTNYGTVLEYTCRPGYSFTAGSVPRLLCKGDGSWSADRPQCEKLHCPLPHIEHAKSITPDPVLYQQTAVVVCDDHFELDGSGSMLCQADQTFDAVPDCKDIDECKGERGPCQQACDNMPEGSFTCKCNVGFVIDPDNSLLCKEIDECDDENGGCAVTCANEVGSYKCTCLGGYDLFTADGTNGKFLSPKEDGSKRGDVLHIDHTCVPRKCPDLEPLENGEILSKHNQNGYFFEDPSVYFVCNLGFEMQGNNFRLCGAGSTWIGPMPTCKPATCQMPSTPGESRPTFVPTSGPIAYEGTVTMTCTQFLPAPVEFERKCIYDQESNSYLIQPMECPVVDCGGPSPATIIPAAVFGGNGLPPTNTKYQAQFTITCGAGSQQLAPTGNAEGGNVVVCRDDSNWDYGAFRCDAKKCTDPGSVYGATQNRLDGTYELGKRVEFTCKEDGFALTDDTLITCVLDNNANAVWDRALPECVDVAAPAITQAQGLCGTTITIEKLSRPSAQGGGFALPVAVDNSGQTENTLDLVIQPTYFHPDIIINTDTNVKYTFTDKSNNAEECDVEIKIRDDQYPELTCPDSYTLEIDSEVGSEAIPTAGRAATASDNEGDVTPVYSISEIANTVGRTYDIEVTATDLSLNEVSCKYQVYIAAKKCTPLSLLRDPKNGVTECTARTTNPLGYDCIVQCAPGTYLYNSEQSSTTYSCNDGSDFNIARTPDCLPIAISEYIVSNYMEYDIIGDLAVSDDCLQTYYKEWYKRSDTLAEVGRRIGTVCKQQIAAESNSNLELFSVEPVLTDAFLQVRRGDIANTGNTAKVTVTLSFGIYPRNLTFQEKSNCGQLIDFFLKSPGGFQIRPIFRVDSVLSPFTCQAIQADNALEKASETFCPSGYKKAVSIGSGLDSDTCLPCPYGNFYDPTVDSTSSGFCSPCPLGQYNDGFAQTQCTVCPANTYTQLTGSNSNTDCKVMCSEKGLVSNDKLAPCKQCPKGKYASDSDTCENCPTGTDTAGPGASSVDDCKAFCAAGSWSFTGVEPCAECPLHYYQPSTGATDCQACGSTQITRQTKSSSTADCTAGGPFLCDPNPCQENGVCSVQNHAIQCTCQTSYTGPRCEVPIDYCEDVPCLNALFHANPDQICASDSSGYTCNCPTEFTGNECQVEPDNCQNSNCQNGGMCHEKPKAFECLCMPGFTGDNCDVTEDICITDPCENSGTCNKINSGRRSCECLPGFKGYNCEINIDDCASKPCLYGAECTDGANDYTCACPSGYGGTNCDIRPVVCTGNPCSQSGVCWDDYRDNEFMCICNYGYNAEEQYSIDNQLEWILQLTEARLTVNGQCSSQALCDDPLTNPCQNGATCQNVPGADPTCTCPTGFEGTLCQHNIDDCTPTACGDNGQCVDGANTYTCTCDPGYKGNECEVDINECQDPSYPCSSPGTDIDVGDFGGCNQYENDFQCLCHPGYDGKTCEINIDECASNPCLNDANCTDAVNTFNCECHPGWEGKRCEVITESCGADTCNNGAECRDVFGEAFCRCEYPFYGPTCEQESSPCLNPPPCIDEKAVCLVDGDTANCECSIDYTGRGCEMAVDYCATEGHCRYGGKCTSKLDGFECECTDDFEGEFCETSRDQCVQAGVPCLNGGICVDGVGKFFCQCPKWKTGPNCDKDVDDDFDLVFQSNVGNAWAVQAFPFTLGYTSMSVGMWVRFMDRGGEGTFFTLYGLDARYPTAPKRELLRLTHDKIYLTLDGFRTEEAFFTLYDINDGQWYYTVVLWDGATGTITVIVNSVKVAEMKGHATGVTLAPYGLVVLGAEVEERGLEAEMDTGFEGYISRLNIWNSVLDFVTEIPPMADDPDFLEPSLSSLQLRWDNYDTKFGSREQRPSRAKAAVCADTQFAGPNCDVPLPDNKAPRFTKCPHTKYTYSPERLNQVLWGEVEAEGHTGGVRSLYQNGSVFIPGSYENLYLAYDEAGNADTCIFKIFVRNKNCGGLNGGPSPPLFGDVECSNTVYPFKTCEPECDAGREFSVSVPKFYTCGPRGSFNVENPFLDFMYPACAPATNALVDVKVTLRYEQIQACDEVLKVGAFKIAIVKRITLLNTLWGPNPRTSGGFCGTKLCSEVVIVTHVCGNTSGRKKRATEDATVTLEIMGLNNPLHANKDDNSQSPEEILLSDILDNSGFNFEDTIPGAEQDEEALVIEQTAACEEGKQLKGDTCVDCSAGTYWNVGARRCEQCPIGQYQNQEGTTSCETCPADQTTELVGSTARTMCYASCRAGSYLNKQSNSGTGGCEFCEKGYYQPQGGQFFCFPCPADKTTQVDNGAISPTQCVEVCPSGTEISGSGGCVSCRQGTYRTRGVQDKCEECGTGYVTEAPGAFARDQCTVPDCAAGEYIDDQGTPAWSDDTCEPCAVGNYQSAKWSKECTECPPSYTTASTGSTASTDCLFYCDKGEEEAPLGSRVCRKCAQGSFKNNENPGVECQECKSIPGKEDYVTPDVGATSSAACTLLGCEEGEQPNPTSSACIKCPTGTFQDQEYQPACKQCAAGTWTKEDGATSGSQCEQFCPDGEFRSDFGACLECPRGTYRNNINDRFGECELCRLDFITAAPGASSVAECTVKNCTAGFKREGNVCTACPIGEYQNEWWQTECKTCPPQKTTTETGSDELDDCLLSCPRGQEDNSDACEPCAIGYYKSKEGSTRCEKCPAGFITADLGADASTKCDVGDCSPGTYRDIDKQCYPCDKGTYQDKRWQSACKDCPLGTNGKPMTTQGEGADDVDECILNCASGYEFDNNLGRCALCPRGYYRDERIDDECQLCPLDRITPDVGGESQGACIQANCSAGYYREQKDNRCEECPVGQYQPNKWQVSCLSCPTGMSTRNTGSRLSNECVRSCPSGQELVQGSNSCKLCEVNQYRNDQQSFNCQDCPASFIANRKGATAEAECTNPACPAGQYVKDGVCEMCPDGYYQPAQWQLQCIQCPFGDKSTTGGMGATQESQCESTDDCVRSSTPLCPTLGEVCVDDQGMGAYHCECGAGYTSISLLGDDTPPCQDLCNTDFCLNDAVCMKQSGTNPLCECTDNWTGPRCETFQQPPDMTPFIIGGAVGGFVFLLLLILLIVWVCWCVRDNTPAAGRSPLINKGGPMMMPIMNPAYADLPKSIIAKPATSTLIYPAGQTMFADNQSLAGYSAMGNNTYMQQPYVFYQDADETNTVYGTYAENPYEEKVQAITLQ